MKFSIPEISDADRIWLKTAFEISKANRRPNFRQMKRLLANQLPKDYDPAQIPRTLINSEGEDITLLGAIAISDAEEILSKANLLINSLQEILIANGEMELIQTSKLAEMVNMDTHDAALLLLLFCRHKNLFYTMGTVTPDYYGVENFKVDTPRYKQIMQLKRAEDLFEMTKPDAGTSISDNDSEVLSPKSVTIATQVLAMHYLLKNAGLNPIDKPSAVARFIQFFNGKEAKAKRIQDTNIYRKVSNPFKLNEKALMKDLQTIRPYFEEMELYQIVEMIDKEIEECKKSG